MLRHQSLLIPSKILIFNTIMAYPFLEIEKKWQKYWDDHQTFKVVEDTAKQKLYILDMFPYPSGSGLHVGHPEGYTATDIYTRFKRMNGFNVLHPMGWDAFGLPAERYAMQTGIHPSVTTLQNIATFKRQIKMLGLSYDWSREVNTTDPKYYKWTQWIFLKIYNSWYDTKLDKARPISDLLIPPNLSEKENELFVQDTKSVVQPYRDKVVIESSFRDIKSFIEIAPVHVWNSEHVRAHYTICVLAYLMDRTLTLNLHERQGDASREIIAHERLYEELDKCRLNRLKVANSDLTAYTFTESTEKQEDLLDRLQMQHLTSPTALQQLSSRGLAASYV